MPPLGPRNCARQKGSLLCTTGGNKPEERDGLAQGHPETALKPGLLDPIPGSFHPWGSVRVSPVRTSHRLSDQLPGQATKTLVLFLPILQMRKLKHRVDHALPTISQVGEMEELGLGRGQPGPGTITLASSRLFLRNVWGAGA